MKNNMNELLVNPNSIYWAIVSVGLIVTLTTVT